MKLNKPYLTFLTPFFFIIVSFVICNIGRCDQEPIITIEYGESIPTFSLPSLYPGSKEFTHHDLNSCASLVVFWASWCHTCRSEHPLLVKMQKQYKIPLYGINVQDSPNSARAFLASNGNPYQIVGIDDSGMIGTNFGIQGLPETFLVDKKGKILYRHSGSLTNNAIQDIILPMIKSCKK